MTANEAGILLYRRVILILHDSQRISLFCRQFRHKPFATLKDR